MSSSCDVSRYPRLSAIKPCSNIITHHAEDGSGVGSAIIAGQWSHLLSLLVPAAYANASYDKEQERCWIAPSCLIAESKRNERKTWRYGAFVYVAPQGLESRVL